MRRFVTTKMMKRLLICIVVGLTTSVGVVWMAPILGVRSGSTKIGTRYLTSLSEPHMVFSHYIGTTWEMVDAYAESGFYRYKLASYPIKKEPWWSSCQQNLVIEFQPSHQRYIEEAWGWPMVCMKLSINFYSRKDGTMEIISGLTFGTRTYPIREARLILPIKPIWRGLLVNTSFYAFITWFVLFGRVLWRNSIRRKRGQCLYCRYSVRDLPVCPECGSEVVTS